MAESCGKEGEEGSDVRDNEREVEVHVKHPGTRQRVGESIVTVDFDVADLYASTGRAKGWWGLCMLYELKRERS